MLEETASLNRSSYGHNNPNKFRDPSGNYVESAWDIFSLGVGLVSFAYNIKEGQYGAAALDAVGIVADTVALAVPLLPGGAGAAIKASRAVQATVKGLQTVDRAANAGMAVANAYVEYTQGNYGWAALNAGFAVLGAKGAYESATGVRAAWKATTAVPDPLKTVPKPAAQVEEIIGGGNGELASLEARLKKAGVSLDEFDELSDTFRKSSPEIIDTLNRDGAMVGMAGLSSNRAAQIAGRSSTEVADRARVAALIKKARDQGDPGVPQLISRLEKAGLRVKDTNHYVGIPLREVDIEMASGVILQVKNLSNAKKIIEQVQDTERATGQLVIAFILQQHRRANKIIQEAGRHVPVTNDIQLLINILK
jgi:hypothetical protein